MKEEGKIFWDLINNLPIQNVVMLSVLFVKEYLDEPEIIQMYEQALAEWLIKKGLLE